MSVSNYHIRSYNKNDQKEIIDIFLKNTPQFFALAELKDLEYYLNNEIEYYYVIEFENRIIGSGGINFPDSLMIARLSWDIINPDFQGLGFGQKLLKHRIDIIKKLNTANQVEVRTSQFDYKFYEKMGFNIIFTETDYWAKGIDLVYMSKNI